MCIVGWTRGLTNGWGVLFFIHDADVAKMAIREGLKIPFSDESVGSTPSFRITALLAQVDRAFAF